MGSPIFYIDKKTKKYKIIGTCTQDIDKLDILTIIKNNSPSEDLDKAKSTFLIPSTFREDFLPEKPKENESA